MQNSTSSIFSKVLALLFMLNIMDHAIAQSPRSNQTSISTNFISSCKYGYFYSNNQCHQCLVSCSRCVDLVTPCASCGEAQIFNDDSKSCLPCKIGQLWCSNNSITCQPHYYFDGKQCIPICAVQNCKSCPTIFSNICTQCKTGYTLTKNSTCSVLAISPTKRNLQSSSNSVSPTTMIPIINNSSAIKQVSKLAQQQYNQTIDVTPVKNISFQASKTQQISNFTGIIKGVVENKTSEAASTLNIPALINETVPSLNINNIPQFNSSSIPTLQNSTEVKIDLGVPNNTSSSPSVDVSSTLNIPTSLVQNKTDPIVNASTSTIAPIIQNSNIPTNNQSITTNSTTAKVINQNVETTNPTTLNKNNITESNTPNTSTQSIKNSSSAINATTQVIGGTNNSTIVVNNSIETRQPVAVIPVQTIATTTTNTTVTNNNNIAPANTSSAIPTSESTQLKSQVDFSKVGPVTTPPAPPAPAPKPKSPPLAPSSTQKQILKDTSLGENIQNIVLPIQMISPMCQVGYYPSGVECRKCEAKCATCINSADQCLQCASGWRRLGWKCVANQGLGFTFNLLVPPVLVSQALPSNTTTNSTTTPTDLTAYISQLKSYLLQSCLPKEYSSLSPSILTLQNLKQVGRSFTISGIIDKISSIPLNQLQSSLTQKLKKTNNIGNVVLSDFKLYQLGAGIGGVDGKTNAETIVPDKENKATKIIVPILIGLAVLLSLITAFCCYKKKKCCFKDKQEEPNIRDYQNEQKGPTQRALYTRNTQMMNYHRPKQATATELVQQHADQKQKQKQGYNYEYEIQSDDQRAGAMRDTYNSQGIEVVDYEKGHGVEGKGYQPRLF